MKAQREAVREQLYGLAKNLEVLVARAKEEGSPERREIMVRMGKRAVSAIERQLKALSEIGAPQPWVTSPTTEREAQAGEAPIRTVTTVEGQPDGVNHRWLWPVASLHSKWLAAPEEVVAAQRLHDAFNRLGNRPGTMDYDGAMRAVDPARRLPLRPEQEGAWEEFEFVMRRLTAKERRVAWCLVIQAPLTGEAEALKAQTYVQKFWEVRGNSDARMIGYGLLMSIIDRLAEIYRRWDVHVAQQREGYDERMREEYRKHIARVPNSRVKLPAR